MRHRSGLRDTFTTNVVGSLLLQAFARCVILSNLTWHFFAMLIGRKGTLFFSRTGGGTTKFHEDLNSAGKITVQTGKFHQERPCYAVPRTV